jgi:hypothetical protein
MLGLSWTGRGRFIQGRKIFFVGALLEELLAVRCPPTPPSRTFKKGLHTIP